MTLRVRTLAAAVLGFCVAHSVEARAADFPSLPVPGHTVPADNQSTAEAVASRLKQSGLLQHYNLTVAVRQGAVELTGAVASDLQRQQVLSLVRQTPGVVSVVDRMTLLAPEAIRQVQAIGGGREAIGAPTPQLPPRDAAQGGMLPEPAPIYQAPAPAPYDLNPPHMPPYAWPTYAPYNNFSRVAYPTTYPYQAWPYIGPCHPFPKVPLGWRAVKLEWEDGHWWFSKTATKNDWWRLRYW